MRWVSTRVLPEPAPARTSSGPSPWTTACALGLVQPGEQPLGAVGAGFDRGPALHASGGLSESICSITPRIATAAAGPALR